MQCTIGKDSDLVGETARAYFFNLRDCGGVFVLFQYVCLSKPFAAGSYAEIEAVTILGATLQYKTILIISQVIGYCLSKFMGIKIISEMPASRRALSIALHRHRMGGPPVIRGYSCALQYPLPLHKRSAAWNDLGAGIRLS